jgi:hypothetical protein
VDVKRVSVYIGHSSMATTIDRYGQLLHSAPDESRKLLDAFHGHGMGTAKGAE